LPVGPALPLPSGDLGVLDHGRLFYHQRWVAAMGVSSRVFWEVRDWDDCSIPGRLSHELRGYLTVCGCELIPLFKLIFPNAFQFFHYPLGVHLRVRIFLQKRSNRHGFRRGCPQIDHIVGENNGTSLLADVYGG
jgi:hypothetical protein